MRRGNPEFSGGPEVAGQALEADGDAGIAGSLLVRGFRALLRRAGDPDIQFALASGLALNSPRRSVGRIRLRNLKTLWQILRSPELGFGDAFTAGDLQVEGDLKQVLFHLFSAIDRGGRWRSTAVLRAFSPAANTLHGARSNIHRHYDLGNDFYALWLDEDMLYTCAYYRRRSDTLEQAQQAKMEHVCRKLCLRPGMQVVEAGCGWGSLACFMARRFGVHVRAFNISEEQVAYARGRVAREGLAAQVEIVHDDYRNLRGTYDAFVSVGMLEHVGPSNYSSLGRIIARCLKPSGLGLLHSVGRARPQPPNQWLERRIFPGSHPPSLSEMVAILEPHDLAVLDVENLRLHYARTLQEWLTRFEKNAGHVAERHGESFVRAWRLYLAGCCAAFMSSSIELYQVLFAAARNNDVPLTRSHLYTDPGDTWAGYHGAGN